MIQIELYNHNSSRAKHLDIIFNYIKNNKLHNNNDYFSSFTETGNNSYSYFNIRFKDKNHETIVRLLLI